MIVRETGNAWRLSSVVLAASLSKIFKFIRVFFWLDGLRIV